jgi:hypothetical protein
MVHFGKTDHMMQMISATHTFLADAATAATASGCQQPGRDERPSDDHEALAGRYAS